MHTCHNAEWLLCRKLSRQWDSNSPTLGLQSNALTRSATGHLLQTPDSMSKCFLSLPPGDATCHCQGPFNLLLLCHFVLFRAITLNCVSHCLATRCRLQPPSRSFRPFCFCLSLSLCLSVTLSDFGFWADSNRQLLAQHSNALSTRPRGHLLPAPDCKWLSFLSLNPTPLHQTDSPA